jgi:type IV pilus biogenesis/stability protein PilW
LNARSLSGILLLSVAAAWLFSSCSGHSEARKREADARMRMGVTYLQQENIPMAMRELHRASELDPSNPEVYMMLGMAYRARGDQKKAEEYLREAIDKNPDYADAHNNLGIVLADRKEWEEAIREFRKAYENVQYQTPERAFYNSAEAYRHKGDAAKAEEQYRQALRLNPGYGPACTTLAEMLSGQGRQQDAEKTLTRCLQAIPDYAEGWMQLGRMYVAMKRPKEAIGAFKNVLSVSSDPEIRKQAAGYISVIGAERK